MDCEGACSAAFYSADGRSLGYPRSPGERSPPVTRRHAGTSSAGPRDGGVEVGLGRAARGAAPSQQRCLLRWGAQCRRKPPRIQRARRPHLVAGRYQHRDGRLREELPDRRADAHLDFDERTPKATMPAQGGQSVRTAGWQSSTALQATLWEETRTEPSTSSSRISERESRARFQCAANGTQADGQSSFARISADGKRVFFLSDAGNLTATADATAVRRRPLRKRHRNESCASCVSTRRSGRSGQREWRFDVAERRWPLSSYSQAFPIISWSAIQMIRRTSSERTSRAERSIVRSLTAAARCRSEWR